MVESDSGVPASDHTLVRRLAIPDLSGGDDGGHWQFFRRYGQEIVAGRQPGWAARATVGSLGAAGPR
jgi:hypothetical protein